MASFIFNEKFQISWNDQQQKSQCNCVNALSNSCENEIFVTTDNQNNDEIVKFMRKYILRLCNWIQCPLLLRTHARFDAI